MKLLMLSRLFPNPSAPTFGQFNLQLAHALGTHCSVEVVAPVPRLLRPPAIPESATLNGVRVRYPRYVSVPLLNRAVAGHSILRTVRKLELRPDAILATFAWPDGYAAVKLGEALRAPVVVKGGGSDIDMLPKSGPRHDQTLFALQRSRRVYVVAEHLRDRIAALGVPAEKIAVIRNGIDPARFHFADQNAARRELDLPAQGQVILSVGWIEPDKGVEDLLRAMAALRARPLLVLVGEPPPGLQPFAAQMRTLSETLGIADRCRFVGPQPHARVATWMNAADVLAFPSWHEGCPNVILEALACGLPIVSTNVGGIPAIAPAAPWCELVPPHDASTFARALDDMLGQRFDRAAIARASERTWADVARDLYGLLASDAGTPVHSPALIGGNSA